MIVSIYELLGSLGYTHPLHPALTHIPMGMIIGAFFFALVSLVLRKEDLARSAHHCIVLALIFVLPTVIAGYMDWQHAFMAEWNNLFRAKIVLAAILVFLLLVAFAIGRKGVSGTLVKLIVYTLCLLVAIALGFLGGEIQYG